MGLTPIMIPSSGILALGVVFAVIAVIIFMRSQKPPEQ